MQEMFVEPRMYKRELHLCIKVCSRYTEPSKKSKQDKLKKKNKTINK